MNNLKSECGERQGCSCHQIFESPNSLAVAVFHFASKTIFYILLESKLSAFTQSLLYAIGIELYHLFWNNSFRTLTLEHMFFLIISDEISTFQSSWLMCPHCSWRMWDGNVVKTRPVVLLSARAICDDIPWTWHWTIPLWAQPQLQSCVMCLYIRRHVEVITLSNWERVNYLGRIINNFPISKPEFKSHIPKS